MAGPGRGAAAILEPSSPAAVEHEAGAHRPTDGQTAGHEGTLFTVLVAGYPAAWALGLSPLWYSMLALPMALWLVRHRPVRVAPGTGYLALFLAVVGLSGIGLESPGSMAIFGLRSSWYIAAFVSYLYLARRRGGRSTVRLVRAMVALWVLVVIGGYLSILTPELSWTTPVAKILPGALADNELISRMIAPQVSETQVFRYEDVVLHRPAAPFAYTNAWGSSFALLTPFVVAAIHDRRIGIPRLVLVPLLAAGLVPLSVALNRGSWLTLGLGLAYGVVRWARVRGDGRPLIVATLLVAAGLAATSLTGVLDSSFEQLETRSAASDQTRSSLYIETIGAAAESPLIGHGSTRPSVDNPTGPPLGTHGQLWAVLFAHGYLGALLYVGFFAAAFLRCRSSEPVQHWTKVALLIGLLQLPIYGHLPHQLFILVGAAALASGPSVAIRSRR